MSALTSAFTISVFHVNFSHSHAVPSSRTSRRIADRLPVLHTHRATCFVLSRCPYHFHTSSPPASPLPLWLLFFKELDPLQARWWDSPPAQILPVQLTRWWATAGGAVPLRVFVTPAWCTTSGMTKHCYSWSTHQNLFFMPVAQTRDCFFFFYIIFMPFWVQVLKCLNASSHSVASLAKVNSLSTKSVIKYYASWAAC